MIQVDGGSTATYVYDAFGRRVKKTVAGYPTEYMYTLDGQIDSMMEGSAGHLTRGFVYLNGRPLVEYANGTTYFVHTDHLGSTRLLTNYPTPTIAESDDYYPFGEFNSSGSTSALKFTADERDSETTLDHTLFRQYSSSLGRWTSPDPLGGDIGNPQSLNRYAYVLNNALAFVDPTGLLDCHPEDCGWFGGGGGFGMDLYGVGGGCRWADFWGGDCAVENRLFAGFFARSDTVLLPGNVCFETSSDYICTNTVNGDFWYYLGRGGARSGKYYLKATSDCGNGGDREIQYTLMQEMNGQATAAMNFTVQEHIQVLQGTLYSAGAPQRPNNLGYSGYDDYISGSGTRDTLQTFTAYLQGGPQVNVFARDVYGHDYGTNGIYVQGAKGAQPAQIFVNNHPTPSGRSCVLPSY